MSNLTALLNEKIKNDFKDKKISIVFNSLPEMSQWLHSNLDNSTKEFFANIVHFLAKRGATIQVINDQECVSNSIAREAWKKCKTKHGGFNKLPLDKLLQADAIVAIACNQKTIDLINTSASTCFVIQTAKQEAFPTKATIITESPNFAISEVIKALNAIWRVRS